MIVDANVLLYAIDVDARHHAASRRWLEEALSGSRPVLLPWVSLLAFLRVSTSRSVFADPLDVERALGFVQEWLDTPCAVVPHPGAQHASRMAALLTPIGAGGNLTTDAHIAALALENGVPVVSFDNDFDRFEGVERVEPQAV